MSLTLTENIQDLITARLGGDLAEIEAFCRRWNIVELALFGSVLRDDFSGSSDVDILVTYRDGVRFGLHDFLDMKEQLAEILGRSPDLLEKQLIENPFLKSEISNTAQVIYVSE